MPEYGLFLFLFLCQRIRLNIKNGLNICTFISLAKILLLISASTKILKSCWLPFSSNYLGKFLRWVQGHQHLWTLILHFCCFKDPRRTILLMWFHSRQSKNRFKKLVIPKKYLLAKKSKGFIRFILKCVRSSNFKVFTGT